MAPCDAIRDTQGSLPSCGRRGKAPFHKRSAFPVSRPHHLSWYCLERLVRFSGAFRPVLAERALGTSAAEAEPRPEPARPRRGRPPLDDKHYRRVALMYLNAMRKESGRPIPWMAEKLRHEPSTVRGWVSEVRGRGFLTPGTRGKAGALPGPRLTGGEIKWQKTLGPTRPKSTPSGW